MSARVSVFSQNFGQPRLLTAEIVKHRAAPDELPAPIGRAAFDALMAPRPSRITLAAKEPWCSDCGGLQGVEGHNLRCALNGERSYTARSVPTARAHFWRMRELAARLRQPGSPLVMGSRHSAVAVLG